MLQKHGFTTLVLLESCGHGLLLDGGEPLSTLLIRHGTDLNEIDGMVITHLHSDHAGSSAAADPDHADFSEGQSVSSLDAV